MATKGTTRRRIGRRPWPHWGVGVVLGLLWVVALAAIQGAWGRSPLAEIAPPSSPPTLAQVAPDPLGQSYALYQGGQLTAAAALLQETLAQAQAQGDQLRVGVVLGNLALVQGQLGQWHQAQESIQRAIAQVQSGGPRSRLLPQMWAIQGQLYLAQSQGDAALGAFQQAAAAYETLGDVTGLVRSRIQQAQALQSQGFYRRALTEILQPLEGWLRTQPDGIAVAAGWQSLGEALLVSESTSTATTVLERGLAVVERLAAQGHGGNALGELRAALYINLGNVARSRQDAATALAHYTTAAAQPGGQALRAQLNALHLLAEANPTADTLARSQTLMALVTQEPWTAVGLRNRINFAFSLLQLRSRCPSPGPCPALPWEPIATLLEQTHTQAQTLGDRRAAAYALGLRGTLALRQGQLASAQQFTEQALGLAVAANATDMSYRWHEQLGEIFEQRGEDGRAIVAYQAAVNTLKRLRTDLLAVNPDLQFSFQKSVEPIHRKLVSLLLRTYEQETSGNRPNPAPLQAARQVIESLQQEELNNYLRAACLDIQAVQLDDIGQAQSTAILYPILLRDRIATIVSYPGQGGTKQAGGEEQLSLYPVPVAAETLETTLRDLRRALTNRISLGFRPLAQQVYEWVIRPVEADLAAQGIDTLVFVLDGGLRNVPMAALFDGEKFLIEKYAIALTPGLQLLAPQPLQDLELSTLAFGLSEAVTVEVPATQRRINFSPLPNVETELTQIQALLPRTQILVNQDFTPDSFRTALATTRAPIVHLATHGQFSSNQAETFLVTAGGRTITLDDLTTALQATATNRAAAVELLVLSACETAAGDDRAALGLAGIAVRAGARSTLASLWQVDDVATSQLMAQFYTALTTGTVTKADALRSAQLAILADPRYRRHPYFWSPFVLVGNWL